VRDVCWTQQGPACQNESVFKVFSKCFQSVCVVHNAPLYIFTIGYNGDEVRASVGCVLCVRCHNVRVLSCVCVVKMQRDRSDIAHNFVYTQVLAGVVCVVKMCVLSIWLRVVKVPVAKSVCTVALYTVRERSVCVLSKCECGKNVGVGKNVGRDESVQSDNVYTHDSMLDITACVLLYTHTTTHAGAGDSVGPQSGE